MGFSEKIKLEIKKKCHQRCCICQNIGVEIHHIIPQWNGGSDLFENGAPLCPTCHEIYGENPTKRKFIRESRDIWYRICETRFDVSNERIVQIENEIESLKSKLIDLESIKSIENKTHILTIGEILDFYNKQPLCDKNIFDLCYYLIFETNGVSDSKMDFEFNNFRDYFMLNFGLMVSENIINYCCNTTNINWKLGFSEEELLEYFNYVYLNMLTLIMNSDISAGKFKLAVIFNEDKTRLLYRNFE